MDLGRVVLVSREYGDLAGAGGLKDVVHALAGALVSLDISTTVVIPRYSFVPAGTELTVVPVHYSGSVEHAVIRELNDGGVQVLTVETPGFLEKKNVYTYTSEDAPSPEMAGKGHEDVNRLNSIFQEAAVRYLLTLDSPPDVVHCHDAHTGLIGAFMRELGGNYFGGTGVLTTIHNGGYAYQQIPGTLEETAAAGGLDTGLLAPGVLNGTVNPFLLAGEYGLLNTVSPGYAKELLSGDDDYSGGLGAELAARGIPLPGIVNGLDYNLWIERSRILPGGNRLPEGAELKTVLGGMLGNGSVPGVECFGRIPDSGLPWVLFHGRLAYQKGINEVLDLVTGPDSPVQPGKNCCIIVYGQGDLELELKSARIAEEGKGMFYIRGYHNQLTAPLIAASSFILVPSRWEPCGQIDMIGQLLGALPIVRRVGGLKKIRNNTDGFSYGPEDEQGLGKKLKKALEKQRKNPDRLLHMRQQAENTIYERRSWRKILIRGYLPLYKKAQRLCRKHTGA